MNAGDALDLPFRGEALVETFGAEGTLLLFPRRQPLFPTLDASFRRVGVDSREISTYPYHGFDGDRFGYHVAVVAPRISPHSFCRLEEVTHAPVILFALTVSVRVRADLLPVRTHPAVQLVEELRLKYPFVLLTASAKPIDAVLERAVVFLVKVLDQPCGKTPVRIGPRHTLVKVHEVTFVNTRRRRIDDDEHLGREVLAAPVENDARHVDARGLGGMLLQIEPQRGKAVLAVDDEVARRRLLEIPYGIAIGCTEAQGLGGKEKY